MLNLRRPRYRVAAAAITALSVSALAACGSDSTSTAADGSALDKVSYSQSTPTLSFAPVLVARDMGFFEDNGIDLDFTTQESGSVATQALLSGSIQFAGLASTDIVGANAKGADLQSIESMINMTMEVCVNKEFMEKAGVTADDPVDQKLAIFKDAKIGITAAGSVSDRAMRWLLKEQGGLSPDENVTIVATNGASALNAALQTNQIQGYLLSPPQCEQAVAAGYAEVLMEPTEVEEFSNVVLQVLVAQKSYLDENGDLAKRFAKSVAEGNDYILEHPDEATTLLQKAFPETDADIVAAAVTDVLVPQIPKGGESTADDWTTTEDILQVAGVDGDVDLTEGGLWTNDYLK